MQKICPHLGFCSQWESSMRKINKDLALWWKDSLYFYSCFGFLRFNFNMIESSSNNINNHYYNINSYTDRKQATSTRTSTTGGGRSTSTSRVKVREREWEREENNKDPFQFHSYTTRECASFRFLRVAGIDWWACCTRRVEWLNVKRERI